MQPDKVYDDVLGKLSSWSDSLADTLPNVIAAILVLVLFWLAARLAFSASDRALRRFNTHQAARDLIARITQIGVLLAGVVVALGVMNLDKALASILAGAGIVGLAIHQRWPFKIGDVVETNDVFGVVEKIHLRTSIIRTLDGKVECGVSYGDDLDEVHRVVAETLDGIESRDPSRDVEVFFTGFGNSSINVVGRFWVDYAKNRDFLDAQSRAVVAGSHLLTVSLNAHSLDQERRLHDCFR